MGKRVRPPTSPPAFKRAVLHRNRRTSDQDATSIRLALPRGVIAALRSIDQDLNRAIVRVALSCTTPTCRRAVELTPLDDRSAVILVPNKRALATYTGLELFALPDGRALLCPDGQQTIPDVEGRLAEAFADPEVPPEDKGMIQNLIAILQMAQDEGFILSKRRLLLFSHESRRCGRGA